MTEDGRASAPPARRPYAHARLRGDVLRYERLGSTNSELRALATAGAPEGTVVVADAQTAGRGRFGRAWSSPAGAGFYGSFLLRPRVPPRRAQLLTLVAAVATAEALLALGAHGVEIKWPNDVLIGGRKASGILTEASFVGDITEWAVVGIGVNVLAAAVPPELAARATSLEAEGVDATAGGVLGALLGKLDRHYAAFLEDGGAEALARWSDLAPMAFGRRVTVDAGDDTFSAVTDGLTADGLLRVLRDGRVVELSAADVTLAPGRSSDSPSAGARRALDSRAGQTSDAPRADR